MAAFKTLVDSIDETIPLPFSSPSSPVVAAADWSGGVDERSERMSACDSRERLNPFTELDPSICNHPVMMPLVLGLACSACKEWCEEDCGGSVEAFEFDTNSCSLTQCSRAVPRTPRAPTPPNLTLALFCQRFPEKCDDETVDETPGSGGNDGDVEVIST